MTHTACCHPNAQPSDIGPCLLLHVG
jgi:hypothetical protein